MNRIELETEDGKLGEVVDDVLSKMARGESVDVEQYAAEHPDVAEVLRHAIPALRAVAQSSSSGLGTRVESGGPLGGEVETPISPNRSLGDYKIVRELGRGGMGVVYEAEQISLGRKVALKVLPFAGMVRGNALQRFQNEVRAAATLDHPNIVSVYSVGEERGVHYYAMQLVRGQSLAEVIAQLETLKHRGRALTANSISEAMSAVERQVPSSATEPTEELPSRSDGELVQSTRVEAKSVAPTIGASGHDRDFYRSIVVLAAQAADALQHAHDSGVIHRDIKPGNLMLDAQSQLYVTDFGLARIESDAAMTMTGDLIGTLRYMSPEQALAKRVVIDHRSDIYSLGMTLYELLTLRPAFTASDRQELLKQIAFEDPTRPRQLDRSIPAELETIVLKSIEKNPEDRYATAVEMGDDLRAFLDDRPIQAKRPTLTQRTKKWARRNRILVNTAAATLAIAIAIGGGLLWRERANTLAAFDQVSEQRREAVQAKALADKETEKAKAAKEESEANLSAALNAIEKLLTHSSDPALIETPQAQSIRKRILTDALAFYEQFKSESGNSPEIRFRAAMTRMQLGDLTLDYRDWYGGEQILSKASQELEQLVKEFPTEVRYRVGFTEALGQHGRSSNWTYLGDTERRKRGSQQSMLSYQRQKKEFQRLAELDPANRNTYELKMIESEIGRAGMMGQLGDSDQASRILEKIRESLQRQSPTPDSFAFELLVSATDRQALVLKRNEGDPERVKSLYRESIELGRTMLTQRSSRELRRQQIGRMGAHFPRYLLQYSNDDEIDEAQQCVAEAIELAAQLVREYPNVPQYFMHLHNNCKAMLDLFYRKLADARSTGDDRSAEELSEQITEFRTNIARDYGVHRFLADEQAKGPDNIQRLTESIQAYPEDFHYFHSRGELYRDLGKRDLALADFNRAVELVPQHLLYPYHQIQVHRSRGDLYAEIGEYDKAIADYNRELNMRGPIGVPATPQGERSAYLFKRRGAAHFYLGKYDEALTDIGKSIELNHGDVSALWWISPSFVGSCPDTDFRSGLLQLADRVVQLNDRSAYVLIIRGIMLEALGQSDRAAKDFESAVQQTTEALKAIDFLNRHAWSYAINPQPSPNSMQRAVTFAKKAVSLAPDSSSYWNTLGVVQYRTEDFAGAIKSLEKSEELSDGANFGYDGVFLAMAHWKLGNKTEAREFYDKALAWREKNEASEELDRFYDEADELFASTAADTTDSPNRDR